MSRAHASGRAAAFVAAGLVAVSIGCSDSSTEAPTAPEPFFGVLPQQAFDAVMRAQERHTAALLAKPGVVGTAVTRLANGAPAVQVFVENAGVAGVPATLDGFPVSRVVSGKFWIIAVDDPTTKERPAPLGFSVAHPNVTAGSIGFRVTNGTQVFILSNNHVLANSNNASTGDAALQPGPADGGDSGDKIGTLADFQLIQFGSNTNNLMDAAIAVVNGADLLGSSPSEANGGYGAPSPTIWGDTDPADGTFDDVGDLLNVQVKKYGRTTELTSGPITGVNATVTVCYSGFIFCTRSARFVDQLIVGSSGFSAGGDSGSGVVTASGNNPVGLLFAGSSSQTILNRIDHVLKRFNVTVDPTNEGSPDPDPVTDLAVDAVTTASPATEGTDQNVTVTVRNVGNQTITSSFTIVLQDETTSAQIGSTFVNDDVTVGATLSRTFSWTPTAPTGQNHTLVGSHNLSDANLGNNTNSTTVSVNASGGGGGSGTTMHVAALSGSSTNNGSTWTAHATITIRDDQSNLVSNASVSGSWSNGTTGSGNCTTNGNGVCTINRSSIPKRTGSVLFTVTGVSHATLTYNSSANVASSVTISKP